MDLENVFQVLIVAGDYLAKVCLFGSMLDLDKQTAVCQIPQRVTNKCICDRWEKRIEGKRYFHESAFETLLAL